MATQKKKAKPKSPKKPPKQNIGQKPQMAPVDWYGQSIINIIPGHP